MKKEESKEVIEVDGISYTVYRSPEGSTVDSPCQCFGSLFRIHSSMACPWLIKRAEEAGKQPS